MWRVWSTMGIGTSSMMDKGVSPRWFMNWFLPLVACGCFSMVFAVAPKSTSQLLLLPFVYFVFWKLSFLRVRVPRGAFIAAVIGTLIGVGAQRTHVGLAHGAFLVAGGHQWDLNQEIKIYRDRLRRGMYPAEKSLVGLSHESIGSEREADALLSASPSIGGVVWGSFRWMNVSLRRYPPVSLGKLASESVGRALLEDNHWRDLQLVGSVPSIGLSDSNDSVTLYFIANLIRLWRDFPSVVRTGDGDGSFDVTARSLSMVQARWTARAHLALPLWMSGTYHLVRAVEGRQIEGGDLACAIRDLELAISICRPYGNPVLQAAIRNNYAVALLARAHFEVSGRESRKNALEQLAAASRLARGDPQTFEVVTANRRNIVATRRH